MLYMFLLYSLELCYCCFLLWSNIPFIRLPGAYSSLIFCVAFVLYIPFLTYPSIRICLFTKNHPTPCHVLTHAHLIL